MSQACCGCFGPQPQVRRQNIKKTIRRDATEYSSTAYINTKNSGMISHNQTLSGTPKP
jgi:hypothetical protein